MSYSVYKIIIIIVIFILGIFIGRLTEKIRIGQVVKKERKDAVKRSRAVLTGQISEQLAPFFPDFPANPNEIRFIGKPIDFIAFKGSSENEITEVIFIEVKSGNSVLSKTERSLKNAIENRNIRYVEYRIKNSNV